MGGKVSLALLCHHVQVSSIPLLQSDVYVVGAHLHMSGLGLQYFFDIESLSWNL